MYIYIYINSIYGIYIYIYIYNIIYSIIHIYIYIVVYVNSNSIVIGLRALGPYISNSTHNIYIYIYIYIYMC